MTAGTGSRWLRTTVVALSVGLVAAGCTSGGGSDGAANDPFGDPGDCTVVDLAVSSEKIDLMTDLAQTFNRSAEAKIDGGCAFVRPVSKPSGGATTMLAEGWDESTEGPRPVIWSPAATSWGQILNQKLANDGQPAMVTSKPVSFMLTPLVIGMPKPMADALGYPKTPIGWADIAKLATSKEGWAAYGHPEWGVFKLGKTNPNFSTSGLNALIGQNYAATGKTRDLSLEDLNDPKTKAFGAQVESAVVHYGDITMTFLNNWFRTDRNGTSLLYASAVAVEEKSLIDYNKGNPDGVLEPGEVARKPKVPLVAIYPKEGTLYSDSPLYVLDADWVSPREKAGAEAFIKMIQRPASQEKVLKYGFRPGNPDVAIGAPITKANGVDPGQPSKLLQVPTPPVMISMLEKWKQQRKGARVLLVLDVSGSMEEPADPEDSNSETKLELAKRAAIDALDEFNGADEVGLRIFSTNLGPNGDQDYQDLLPVQPMATNREGLASQIRAQLPQHATPLYEVTGDSFTDMTKDYDPDRINAVVLLTDGVNDDGNADDDRAQLNQLLATLRRGTEGEQAKPIRVFTIAYGKQADFDTLQQIAEATNAAAYDASNPATISKVFTAVVSNF
ncbi:substrate-binding domain-containing protein [Aquihabitans sp. McL0605]|uniref:substrate-binding domain-containing protein n=1 Tax=Aquihabitans sp. McL0605 TaxID=3415671 RepID=UPI003CE79DEA